MLGQKEFPVLENIFEEKVTMFVLVPESEAEGCKKALLEAANGKVGFVEETPVYYGEVMGKVKVFP